jgi:hypothetical protein
VIRAAIVTPGKGRTIILGLDRENVRRLTDESKPILVDLAEMGVHGVSVCVCFGETLQALAAEIRVSGIDLPHFDDPKPPA